MVDTTTPTKSSFVSELFGRCRQSQTLILVIVYIALFIDFMLLTTVVPILPSVLDGLKHPEGVSDLSGETTRPFTVNCTARGSLEVQAAGKEYVNVSENVGWNSEDASDPCNDVNAMGISSEKNEYLRNNNAKVGLILSAKGIVQIITDPLIGPLTNRIGYSVPMLLGCVVIIASTITFAFGQSVAVLFVARAVQGIGSSCSSVAGMGILADRYTDDMERGKAIGIAFGGIGLGILLGPVFGGVVYQFAGKEAPFLILSGLALLYGVLLLVMLQPSIKREPMEGPSLRELLMDPYILLAAGSLTWANTAVALLESLLPMWMIQTMHTSEYQQGLAFLPATLSYLVGSNIFGILAHKMGRWLCSALGMVVIGCSFLAIPYCKNIFQLIPSNCCFGLAIAMVDASMTPEMGRLVDLRHVSIYGSVFAICNVAISVGFAIGPVLTWFLVKVLGFKWLLWTVAILNVLYSPLMLFLRNPPGKDEVKALITKNKVTDIEKRRLTDTG